MGNVQGINSKIESFRNRNSFVKSNDKLTVTSLDGTTYKAYKEEFIDRGKVEACKGGIDVWSSSSHPNGQHLIYSSHYEYGDAVGEKIPQDAQEGGQYGHKSTFNGITCNDKTFNQCEMNL